MAADLATLGIRLTNAQAVADAKATGAALEEMGVKGETAARKIAGSSNPVTTAIKQQAIDYTQLTARASDFARAGASAAQVSQMAGVSMAEAAAAVKMYSGAVAKAEIDVVGLKAAQAQLAMANMVVGESAAVAGSGMTGMNTQMLGGHMHAMRLSMGLSSLVGSLTGTRAVFSQLGSTMSSMFIGMWQIVAVLGAIAAASFVWNKMTEGAHALKKETDAVMESLRKVGETKLEVATGQMKLAVGRVAELHTKLEQLTGDLNTIIALQAAHPGILTSLLGSFKGGQANDTQAEITKGERAVRIATANIGDIELEGAHNTARTLGVNLAALVSYNAQDAKARQNSLTLIKAYTADLGRLGDAEVEKRKELIDKIKVLQAPFDAEAAKAKAAQEKLDAAEKQKNAAFLADFNKLRNEAGKVNAEIEKGTKDFWEGYIESGERALSIAEQLTRATNAMRPTVLQALQSLAPDSPNFKMPNVSVNDGGTKEMREKLGIFIDGAKENAKKISDVVWTAAMASAQTIVNALNLGGGGRGSQIGQALGATGGGAAGYLLGAAGGTLGVLGGPVGAMLGSTIGGMVGSFVGGLFDSGKAAREAAKAQQGINLQLDMIAAQLSHNKLASIILGIESSLASTLAGINAALPGTRNETQRNADRARATAQAEEQKRQATEEFARQAVYAQEDLAVRNMRATGQGDAADTMAFRNQQTREMQAAIDANKDATYLSYLATVQNNELTAYLNKTLSSALNVVEGYRLQATIFGAMNPRSPFSPSGVSPFSPSPPSGVNPPTTGPGYNSGGDLTVNVVADGRVIGRAVLKDFQSQAQAQFGESSQWSNIQ